MEIGNIVYYNNERGFGFIVPFGKDVKIRDNHIVFSIRNVLGFPNVEINVKNAVAYEIMTSKKGLQAVNIQIINDDVEIVAK